MYGWLSRYCRLLAILGLLLLYIFPAEADPSSNSILKATAVQLEGVRIERYFDHQGRLTLEQLRENPELFSRDIEGDNAASHQWLRIRFRYLGSGERIMFTLPDPRYSEVFFFQSNVEGLQHSWLTGTDYPHSTRPVSLKSFAFPVDVRGRSVEIFLMLDSFSRIVDPVLYLYSESYFERAKMHAYTINGFLYGMMLALLLYNLVLFCGRPSRAGFFYCSWVLIFIVQIACHDGNAFFLLYPDVPGYFVEIYYLSSMVSFPLLWLFIKTLLDSSNNFPRSNSVINAMVIASLFTTAYYIVYQPVSLPFLSYSPVLVILVILLLIVASIRRGIAGARPLLYAQISVQFLAVGTLLLNGYDQSLRLIFTLFAAPVSAIVMMLLMASALSQQINQLGRESLELAQRSLAAEKSSSQLKNDFLSTITHELLTPINGVLMSLSLMREEVSVEGGKLREAANTSCLHILEMLRSIITFSEARSGQLKRIDRPFDLHEMLRRSQQLFSRYKDKSVSIALIMSDDLPRYISSDEEKIQHMLSQLLKNSLAYSGSGEIVISARASIIGDCSQLYISVKDDGIGITSEQQESIYEAFHQLDSSISREQGGLGIGLTITRDLLTIMGGEISLQSEREGGACFTLQFPVQIIHQQAPKEIITKRLDWADKIVMVVEDNPVNMMLMIKLLEKANYKTRKASNGLLALEALQRDEGVDAILMDCQMPVMDGFEATRRIRQLGSFDNIPIIAVTANISSADQQRCFDAGMNDFVAKPASQGAIELLLSKWLLAETIDPSAAQTGA